MLATSYLHLNKKSKALDILKKFSEEESLKIRMDHYCITKDYKNAIECGERLLELDCENIEVMEILSDIYAKIDYEEWSIFYDYEATRINPELMPMHLFKLFKLRRFDELVKKFESLSNEEIMSGEFHGPNFNFILGASYNQLGRHYDALKYLYRIDNFDSDSNIKFMIGHNYFMLHDYKMSYKFLKDAIKIDESNKIYLRYIGECCLYMGRFLEAIEYSNKALSIDDDYDEPWLIIAAHYLENGKGQKAIETLNYISYDSDESDAYIFKIAQNISLIGESYRAMKYFDTLIELMPECPLSYIFRADHYKRIGEESLSKRDLKIYEDMTSEHFRKNNDFCDSLYYELIKEIE